MVKEFHSDYRVSGRMRRVIAAREWEEEEEEEEVGSEWEWERVACLLGFVGMRVHVCTLGSVSVCVLTPGAHPPSLLTLWRALSLSGPFFTSPSFPFYSIPLSFVLSLPFSPFVVSCSSPCPYSLFLLFRTSSTMLRDFYWLARHALNWLRWAGWIGAGGRMDCIDVLNSALNIGSGRDRLQRKIGTIHPVIFFCIFLFALACKSEQQLMGKASV